MSDQGNITRFPRLGNLDEELNKQTSDKNYIKPRRVSVDHSTETRLIGNTTTTMKNNNNVNRSRSSDDNGSRRSSIDVSVDTHQALENGKAGWQIDSAPCPVPAVATRKRRSDKDGPRTRRSGSSNSDAKHQSKPKQRSKSPKSKMDSSATQNLSSKSLRSSASSKSRTNKSRRGERKTTTKKPSIAQALDAIQPAAQPEILPIKRKSSSGSKEVQKQKSDKSLGGAKSSSSSSKDVQKRKSEKSLGGGTRHSTDRKSDSGKTTKSKSEKNLTEKTRRKSDRSMKSAPQQPDNNNTPKKRKSEKSFNNDKKQLILKSDKSGGASTESGRRKSEETILTEVMTLDDSCSDDLSRIKVARIRASSKMQRMCTSCTAKSHKRLVLSLTVLILGIVAAITAAVIFSDGSDSGPMRLIRAIGAALFRIEQDDGAASISNDNREGMVGMGGGKPVKNTNANGGGGVNDLSFASSSSSLVPKVEKIRYHDQSELDEEMSSSVSKLGLRGANNKKNGKNNNTRQRRHRLK